MVEQDAAIDSSGRATVDVAQGIALVRSGGVIAYPTEAVFGLGCDPACAAAVERIVALKERDATKGLILVAAEFAQLQPWLAPFEPAWQSRVDDAWPGPVTFVVPARRNVSPLLRGAHLTLAVRVSDHPVVRALTEGCGHALVSTSANRSGQPALRSSLRVVREFGDEVDGVVAGETGGRRRPTAIIDVRTGRSLRN